MFFRRLIEMLVALSIAGLCISCKDDIPSPEGLGMPVLLSARAEGSGLNITLYAEISSPRIDACGFIVTPPGKEPSRILGSLEETTFSASPENLEFNREYAFRAFVTAGENEVLSDEQVMNTIIEVRTPLTTMLSRSIFLTDSTLTRMVKSRSTRPKPSSLCPSPAVA